MILHRAIFYILLVILSGCTSTRQSFVVIDHALLTGFTRAISNTTFFKLTAFEKITKLGEPLVIYLEGDGHSMASKYQLSSDPTPHQPLSLELAIRDDRPNIVYIARPCQYTSHDIDKRCHFKYWSTHRFSKEVISSTNDAIDFYKRKGQANKVHLVGFSGGGGLSVLVAAQRKDVSSVTTIAGDLNLKQMEMLHRATEQVGSLDPLDFAKTLTVSQFHLSGAKDKVVPPRIAQSFVRLTANHCVKHQVMPNFSHHQGWVDAWPAILKEAPCQHG